MRLNLRAIKVLLDIAVIGMILVLVTVIVDNRFHAHNIPKITEDTVQQEAAESTPAASSEEPSVIPVRGTTESASEEGDTEPDSADAASENENEPAADTTPAETEPPETTAPETQPVSSGPVYASGSGVEIHALSAEQLAAISAQYDSTVRGFGGTSYYTVVQDDQNRYAGIPNIKFLCGNGTDKVVAFTFQEGWESGITNQVIDILNSRNVRGSFYIAHEYAMKNPEIVQRMINEGHVVGNHSYACPDEGMATRSLEEQMNDALKMQDYMKEKFGYTMKGYNPNSAVYSEASLALYSQMGYTVVLSSASYVDYSASASINADEVLMNMETALRPGTIYAFHTLNAATVLFLGPLIDYCVSQGYTVITLP